MIRDWEAILNDSLLVQDLIELVWPCGVGTKLLEQPRNSVCPHPPHSLDLGRCWISSFGKVQRAEFIKPHGQSPPSVSRFFRRRSPPHDSANEGCKPQAKDHKRLSAACIHRVQLT